MNLQKCPLPYSMKNGNRTFETQGKLPAMFFGTGTSVRTCIRKLTGYEMLTRLLGIYEMYTKWVVPEMIAEAPDSCLLSGMRKSLFQITKQKQFVNVHAAHNVKGSYPNMEGVQYGFHLDSTDRMLFELVFLLDGKGFVFQDSDWIFYIKSILDIYQLEYTPPGFKLFLINVWSLYRSGLGRKFPFRNKIIWSTDLEKCKIHYFDGVPDKNLFHQVRYKKEPL